MRARFTADVDPTGLARRLARAGAPGLAVLDPRASAGWAEAWVACAPDAVDGGLVPPEASLEGLPATFPRWVGVLPYEAFRHLERPRWSTPERRSEPLVRARRWQRYGAAARFVGGAIEVHGAGEGAERIVEALRAGSEAPGAPRVSVRDADPPEAHAERVRRAIELIRAGDLYQVNLARRLDVRADAPSPATAVEIYDRLARAAAPPFGALLDVGDAWVLSTSPELLLDAAPGPDGTTLATEPIKGTRPRHADPARDAALARELDGDPKERAELAMIVDVERNDLGRVARVGSVRVTEPPRVVTYRTVHHRAARVVAVLRDELSLADAVAAAVPSGSVTGAPKVRAMEVVAALEAHRRGLYTGAVGALEAGGRLVLSMAIRTLALGRDGEGAWHTGGGIVLASDPSREVEETRWKALQLTSLLEPG